MNLFDTLTFAEILVGTTFLGTPTLTVLYSSIFWNWDDLLNSTTIFY
jgi:hypothetical protein